MITFRSKTDVTDADAIFSEINSRFVAAIMMHGQMADYFDFLGLKGYKRIHEYQHIAESLERADITSNGTGKLFQMRFLARLK